jgi:hypothetical protein
VQFTTLFATEASTQSRTIELPGFIGNSSLDIQPGPAGFFIATFSGKSA